MAAVQRILAFNQMNQKHRRPCSHLLHINHCIRTNFSPLDVLPDGAFLSKICLPLCPRTFPELPSVTSLSAQRYSFWQLCVFTQWSLKLQRCNKRDKHFCRCFSSFIQEDSVSSVCVLHHKSFSCLWRDAHDIFASDVLIWTGILHETVPKHSSE